MLAAARPSLVLTRVSPFGQEGPYAQFAASDLILAAIGGAAWMTGDSDRAPVRISTPQYFLHAAAEAAVHTTAALYHAAVTGPGQQIDVSAQLATVRTLMNAAFYPHTDGRGPGAQHVRRAERGRALPVGLRAARTGTSWPR